MPNYRFVMPSVITLLLLVDLMILQLLSSFQFTCAALFCDVFAAGSAVSVACHHSGDWRNAHKLLFCSHTCFQKSFEMLHFQMIFWLMRRINATRLLICPF
ncbi:hypothetical protein ACOSQ3_031067 [Xanthoceras sorbifolium]